MYLEEFREEQVWITSDLSTIKNVEVDTLQLGLSDVLVFAGIGGPYWSDVDGSNSINWAFNTGDGDAASRTLDADSDAVVIGLTTYNPGDEIPAEEYVYF